MHKLCIMLAMNTYTGMDFFLAMPLDELIETCKEINEVHKEAEKKAKKRR